MEANGTNGLRTRAEYEDEIAVLQQTNEVLLRDAATMQIGYMAQRWERMEREFRERFRQLERKLEYAEVALEAARKEVEKLKRRGQ